MLSHLAALLLAVVASAGGSGELPPNGELRVAYRQLERGKLSEPIFHSTLRCWEGTCTLTSITLGECVPLPDLGKVWLPGANTIKTGSDQFVVTKVGDAFLEAEERGGGTTLKYRWSFTTIADESARQQGRKQTRLFHRLAGFSGAAVRSSPVAERIVTWELVPFKGWWVKAPTACEMAIEGVPE